MSMSTIEKNVQAILNALGTAGTDHTKDTPKRFAKFLQEFHQPLIIEEVLGSKFDAKGGGMVVQSPIAFRGLCAHHLCPMLGTASIGYIPNKHIVGLSKMARLVQGVGLEKPGLQEHMCDRIADLFNSYVDPKGVIVTIKAQHTCMSVRGIAMPGVFTMTSSVRGLFLTVPAAREEFFSLVK